MVRVEIGAHTILSLPDALPANHDWYRERAGLAEEFGLDPGEVPCFLAVLRPGEEHPALVVAQGKGPGVYGFGLGALLVPETGLLLIGAGARLLAYDLRPTPVRRLWQDEASLGFRYWRRHGAVVLMSAELELAAWDVEGRKLWTTFVEPPWEYTVAGEMVTLQVMGTRTTFPLRSGPGTGR